MISQFYRRSAAKFFILGIALLVLVLPLVDANNETRSEDRSAASISLENIMFDTDSVQHKVMVLTVRNLGDKAVELDRIFINGKSFAREIRIDPGKALDISQNLDWRGYKSYVVKLSGPGGLMANESALSPSVEEEKNPGMLLLIVISFLIFASLIFIGGWMPTDGNLFRFNLRHGQIRSAIAGTLVFGFVILTFFSLYYPLNEDGAIFNQFSQVVGIIIGFYFGSRTAASPGNPPGEIVEKNAGALEASKKLDEDYSSACEEYEKKVIEESKASEELEKAKIAGDQGKIEESENALKEASAEKDKAKTEWEMKFRALESSRAEGERPQEEEPQE